MTTLKTQKAYNNRLEYLKNLYLKNLKNNIGDKEQRILIAKTKFLAQLLELKGLINSQYRKCIVNYCHNHIEDREAIDDKFYNKLMNIWSGNCE